MAHLPTLDNLFILCHTFRLFKQLRGIVKSYAVGSIHFFLYLLSIDNMLWFHALQILPSLFLKDYL